MADILGISVSAYGNYETGYRAPKLEMLPVIAEKLSTSIDELLGYNTPSEERDLFAECKKLIESIGMDGKPLLVSKTRHLDEKEYSGIVIQRGGELGYPFARFASRAEFIAFVQGIMHDFKESGIYLNARQQFVENALRKEIQRRIEENRQKRKSVQPEDYERVLQYLQSEEWTPKEAKIFERLKELFTEGLNNLAGATNQTRGKKEPIGAPPEDKATNRPPVTSQGVAESPTSEAVPPGQEAPKPRRKRQKKSAPHKDEAPDK